MYVDLLMKQFNRAKGYKNPDVNSEQYLQEFMNWLDELKKQKGQYIEYSNIFGIDLFESDFLEINKGNLDTILGDERVISPFAYTIWQENRVFIPYHGEPYIVSVSKVDKGQAYDTYCTHNPYDVRFFGDLDSLHNNGYNVCFGMYGKNSDCDKDVKLHFVSDRIKHMTRDYGFEYDTCGDNYCCIVFTKKLIKEKVLTR